MNNVQHNAAMGQPTTNGQGRNGTGIVAMTGTERSVLGFSEIQASNGVNMVSDMSSFLSQTAHLSLMTECVSKWVFPYKKFVILEQELEYGQTLQKRVCYKLNVLREQEEWWKENMEIVRKKLGKKRNNVQETIRRKTMSK